jgi:glutamine kinase
MKELKNKSKAETLVILNKRIPSMNIPKTFFFSISDLKKSNSKILNKISHQFNKFVAVRSSNKFEDNKKTSNAGKFKSLLNINSKDNKELINAIYEVKDSYKKFYHKKNQILIQDMVDNVTLSGVCTTCDLETYFPSYQINFFKGGDTSAVTSGKPNTQKITYIDNLFYKINDKKFSRLINVIKKIKKLYVNQHIDVEFAINSKNKIFILQVRPIVINKKITLSEDVARFAFNSLGNKIKKLQKKHHNLLGNTSYYSVMTDWNPAEIIGLKPKPLALSLYQELVTDHIWAKSRKDYGYKDVTSNHLMNTFFGTPYIDIRIDFNSWLPSNLPKKLSEKLINYYLKVFKNNRDLHDKVEFFIIFTCFTFDTRNRIKKLLGKKFSVKEINLIERSLKKINTIAFKKIKDETIKINILEKKQKEIDKLKIDHIAKIYWLIEDCKKYGTYPFAGLARTAFISTELLNSLVNNKIISSAEREKFLQSIKTITTDIKNDYSKSKYFFLKKYGHLRPNTYEISSLNYRDGFNIYFGTKGRKTQQTFKKKFIFSNKQIKKIKEFLKKENFDINFTQFISSIKKSIQLREYSKYIFTKSIDMVFENLKIFARQFGLKEVDLTYLKINKILNMYYNYTTFKNIPDLKKEILYNKNEFNYNNLIKLPEVILDKSDLFVIKNESKINFIGSKKTNGKIFYLNKFKSGSYDKKIICIENADPGFDFIFTKKIHGLITNYGGVNSHMAIRCAELGIPAAIGVGENLFEQIKKSNVAIIDCERKKIILDGSYNR